MMRTLWALAQGSCFGAIAVDAVLSVRGVRYPIRAMDHTGRIAGYSTGAPLIVGSSDPIAAVRASDLAAAGLGSRDLDDAVLTLNGADYRVTSAQPKPSPAGEADGEYVLLLEAI